MTIVNVEPESFKNLRRTLYIYTMAFARSDVKAETLERLEYDVKKACADVAFPVEKTNHPSHAEWEPQEVPTTAQARLAKGFLTVLEGGKQDT